MPQSVETAWTAYKEALDDVLGGASEHLSLVAGGEPAEPTDEAMDGLVRHSQALHEALLPAVAQTGAARELGSLQLQAAAALDFDSANRLAALAADAGG